MQLVGVEHLTTRRLDQSIQQGTRFAHLLGQNRTFEVDALALALVQIARLIGYSGLSGDRGGLGSTLRSFEELFGGRHFDAG